MIHGLPLDRARRLRAFSLIEILAVLLIGGLLMSFMVPNMSAFQAHTLRRSAEKIVERADFGRQRAVITGVSHRLAIDLDEGTYQLEWEGEAAPSKPAAPAPRPDPELGERQRISLAAPAVRQRSYEAVPGPIGALERLDRSVEFAWIETSYGEVDFGEAFITFERDGTSTYTLLVLDEPGGERLALEILPLAEAIRILDEEF